MCIYKFVLSSFFVTRVHVLFCFGSTDSTVSQQTLISISIDVLPDWFTQFCSYVHLYLDTHAFVVFEPCANKLGMGYILKSPCLPVCIHMHVLLMYIFIYLCICRFLTICKQTWIYFEIIMSVFQ